MTISGIPATATIAAGGKVGPVTGSAEVLDGLVSLSVTKDGAALSTTTLTGTDDNSITLTYTVGQETVYANGVLLIRGSDYTASNGTSVVLASGSVTGDVFEVISVIPINLVDVYTQAQTTAQLNNADILTIMGAF